MALVASAVVVGTVVRAPMRPNTPVTCPRAAGGELAGDVDALARPECFFAVDGDYDAARALFRAQAKAVGAELTALKLDPPKGFESDDISIDVAVVRGTDPDSIVLSTSGVHGVEGFTGSAIQSAYLHLLRQGKLGKVEPTVVLVHAVNPFGMKHTRRVNENNVDLNRNAMFNASDFAAALARDPNIVGYETVNDAINPTSFVASPAWFLWHAVKAFARSMSFVDIKRALVTGTYHRHDGVYFGGKQLQQSHARIASFLSSSGLTARAKRFVVIDIHTGLGKHGMDSMMVHGHRDESHVRFFAATSAAGAGAGTSGADAGTVRDRLLRVSPHAVEFELDTGDDNDAAAGYDMVLGHVQMSYPTLFPRSAKGFSFTQEFGTVPTLQVAYATILENAAWHHGTPSDKSYANALLLSCFLPNSQPFAERVVERGVSALVRAVTALSSASVGGGGGVSLPVW